MIKKLITREKYLFDLNGYVVIKNVLTPDEVAFCNRAIDLRLDAVKERCIVELRNTKAGTPLGGDGFSGRKDLGEILNWGEESRVFRSILDHPKLLPFYDEFIGVGYRMDHQPFCIIQNKGSEGFSLHGGTIDYLSGEYNPQLAYTCIQGKIHNHLLAVSVPLTDHNQGDGGLIVVPGSHKSNFAVPEDMINGIDSEFLHQPVVKAGDVILFSEGTVHGAKPWTAHHQRRTALFRFSPATTAYGRSYYPTWPAAMTEGMTETQLAVMEPPYANRLDRPVVALTASEGGKVNHVEVVTSGRSQTKKDFDLKVFGTPYF